MDNLSERDRKPNYSSVDDVQSPPRRYPMLRSCRALLRLAAQTIHTSVRLTVMVALSRGCESACGVIKADIAKVQREDTA